MVFVDFFKEIFYMIRLNFEEIFKEKLKEITKGNKIL